MNQIPKRKRIRRSGYATVRDLKNFIKDNKIPDDALILYQRIEDYYFTKKGGWGESVCTVRKTSELKGAPDDQYTTVWTPIKFKKDDNLYLTAHY